MGKEKYMIRIREFFDKSPVVSHASIVNITGNKSYTKKLINVMLKKGEIQKLGKGMYTSKDSVLLSVFCFQPAYFGLQDALSFHGVWEQETIQVIVTTRNVRAGMRQILGQNVLVRTIKKKYFFGFDYHNLENLAIPYADLEKTVIDLAYFKETVDTNILDAINKKLDKSKLQAFLKKYPKKFRVTVLNLLKE